VRNIFLYQAVTPLIYNLGIILGGVFLAGRYGIDSLAFGVLAGALVGSTLLNAVGAFRSGLRFFWVFDLRHPAFVEWLKLSLPLMIGVSLAMADKWILSYFATADPGGLTRLTNAKTLFNAPLGMIGAAAGAASLPFFSSLYAQRRMYDFNVAVNRAISRLLAVALLMTAWMTALAMPIVDLLRGGSYHHEDVVATARYFGIFALSLALWSAQGIYARAFYAARNTLAPAISGTIVTCVSIPVYALLFHHLGVEGLAMASNLGILTHTLALAVLLHRYRLVSLVTLDYGETGRALVAAAVAYGAALGTVRYLPHPVGWKGDVVLLAGGSIAWGTVCFTVLSLTGSKLIRQILRRG
jgi:putative peptidoglycan lipid II flippase